MSEDRITQSVLDALEDLQISSSTTPQEASLLNDELETLLRSKFPDNTEPACPLDNPTILERLHFLTTCLQQRETLIDDGRRRRAPAAALIAAIPEDLTEAQWDVVRSCQEYLQADYERRRQHMQQRFDVLKETFDNPEDVQLMLVIDKEDHQVMGERTSSAPFDISQFLLPSTNTTNRHAVRQDAPSITSVDRGGRVMQEENRNSMPDFSAGSRQAGRGGGRGGGRGRQGRGKRDANPSVRKGGNSTNESNNKDSLAEHSQGKGEKGMAVADLTSEIKAQAAHGGGDGDGGSGRGNQGRGKRKPRPSDRMTGNYADNNKDSSTGQSRGKPGAVAEFTSENKAQVTAQATTDSGGGKGRHNEGKYDSQCSGWKKENNGDDRNTSSADGKLEKMVALPEATSEHSENAPVALSNADPPEQTNNNKRSNNRSRRRKKPAPK